MRRGGPPPGLRIDRGNVPPWAEVVGGPNGLTLAEAPAPSGRDLAPGPTLRVERGAPVAVRTLGAAADGELLLATSPGVAWSIRTVDLSVIHDRRPAGLDGGRPVGMANAAVLHAADGWRAVVMPSLGDIAADLGPGPVALRGDGRRIAVAIDGGVEEVTLPSGDEPVHHEGEVSAMTYSDAGDLLVARGSAVGPPGVEPKDGSPITELAPAARAGVLAAAHEDGTITVWSTAEAVPEQIGRHHWPAGPRTVSLSLEGEHLALAYPDGDGDEPPFVAVVRASDGALVRWIAGARAIALGADGVACAVGGDWGIAWLTPIKES